MIPILACVCLAGCRHNGPLRRFFRTLDAIGEVAAWACPLVYAIVFLGGGLLAIVQTVRAPTDRSRAWARRLGLVNVLLGAIFAVIMTADPPRVVEMTTAPSGRVEQVALPNGTLVSRPVMERVEVDQGVDVGALALLVGLGLGVAALGGTGLWVSRRS